jgi:hypothetical protein
MKGPVRWGVILGGAVAVLSLVFGLVGWHRIYEMSFVFLAIARSSPDLCVKRFEAAPQRSLQAAFAAASFFSSSNDTSR